MDRGPIWLAIPVFLLLAPSLSLAQPLNVQKPVTADWTKGDHDLALLWRNNLKAAADRLDECTSSGRFANLDAVPDRCTSAYFGALDMLNARPEAGLLRFLQHACAKWRALARAQQHQQDCEELGRRYWGLHDAVDRATIANSNTPERNKTIALGDATTRYVASVLPGEVVDKVQELQELNTELEKAQINPGSAFMAGTADADMASWLLNHCPSELAWGIPAKSYVTGLDACLKLEPQLRRFERNVLRLMALVRATAGHSK